MVVVFVPQIGAQIEIAHLVEYHSYWLYDEDGDRYKNPAFDINCRRLLDLKHATERGHGAAVAHFSKSVETFLAAQGIPPPDLQVYLAVVPSSKKGEWGPGLDQICANLIRKNSNFVDSRRVLERVNTIQKLASGGNRNFSVHEESIRIGNGGNKVVKKTILLLDDIATTGNSLRACAAKLYEAGAAKVLPLALGQTT
ncbi:hypothetical protein [Burkholderia gladioli]|uniref:hypothetical protein n=1 Tax=Burkholderia gladioli TaxID=28095 RepID=UPI00163ED2E1|nr:hypothetical protein [Burkholderia gladioli]